MIKSQCFLLLWEQTDKTQKYIEICSVHNVQILQVFVRVTNCCIWKGKENAES